MTKIVIKLIMNDNFDIEMTNSLTSVKKEISFLTKNINAFDVYELFGYKNDYIYDIESNVDDITDGNEKDYFKEVISLVENIKNEINKINDKKEEVPVEESTSVSSDESVDDIKFEDLF